MDDRASRPCAITRVWPAPASRPRQQPVGLDALTRIDLLPRFKPSVTVASISSYDRTGGNDDGFSGKYSFVRKEPDGLVIADLQGPGVVYRIWTPTPTDDPVEFYFDGEATPRLTVPFRDLFTGKTFPFVAPVSGIGAGGFYTYVPLAYAKSLKILVRAEKVQFYQINYATYPAGTAIETLRRGRGLDGTIHGRCWIARSGSSRRRAAILRPVSPRRARR